MNAPKWSEWRRKLRVGVRRLWVFVWIFGSFVGLVLMGYLRGQYGQLTEGDWPSIRGPIIDALLALFAALLVALVVGFGVDRSARERLAERLAETWLWGLLGHDAPPQLQERAKQVLEQQVVLNLDEVLVELSWTDSSKTVLKIDIHSLNTGRNYGPEPFRAQPQTRVIPSVPGHSSRIVKWDFEVYPLDTSKAATRATFGRTDLEHRTLNDRGVVASAESAQLELGRHMDALRGDSFRLVRCAEAYAAATGVLPLSSARPTVSKTVVLTGSALSDLTIDVLVSGRALEHEQTEYPDREAEYRVGPALAGEWVWVCWGLREQSELPDASAPAGVPLEAVN